MDSCTRRK